MKQHLRSLLFNVVELISAIIGLISLGFIQLDLPYKLSLWITLGKAKKRWINDI